MEDSIRQWMKDIQDLLLESEQLRVESDTNGPQVSECHILLNIT